MNKSSYPRVRVGIGQDSHRFLPPESAKPCMIGGVIFEHTPGLASDSDGDVVFHAICNAISSVTCVSILDGLAKDLLEKDGITDSQVYVEKALGTLGRQRVEHVALAIEGKRPRLHDKILEMRQKIAQVMRLEIHQIGLTVTSGDGLTDFGCGDGLQCFCTLTTVE